MNNPSKKPDEAFYGFVYRTLSSNLVLKADKKWRVKLCANAADSAQLPFATFANPRDGFPIWHECRITICRDRTIYDK
jgi:hypothetical protein